MGRKKFIDKKKSATFSLVFRESEPDDSSDSPARVFTRVDGGESYVKGFSEDDPWFQQQTLEKKGINEESGDEDDSADDDSRFGDADEDSDVGGESASASKTSAAPVRKWPGLDEGRRRELIELGFPDDGYDYLQHMRKIGIPGVGGAFVPASRVDIKGIRADVKAYDASKLQVEAQTTISEDRNTEQRLVEHVISGSRVLRKPAPKSSVLDPDILAALDHSDGSQFDSADELEDEFVMLANEGVEDEEPVPRKRTGEQEDGSDHLSQFSERVFEEKERPARFLDEQFETLALREYDDDDFGELDEDDPTTRGHADLSEFSSVLSDFITEGRNYKEKYESVGDECEESYLTIPSSAEREGRNSYDDAAEQSMIIQSGVDRLVIEKTLEYSYNDREEAVWEEASDEEKEQWDCETIVSTFSNLDNHPAKISAPGPLKPRLRDVGKVDSGVIRLSGKQKLPVEYLPKRALPPVMEETPLNTKSVSSDSVSKVGRRAGETPEEKKARKAAVKGERRQAREEKKALKVLYREDARRAQHGAAVMGPSSMRLP